MSKGLKGLQVAGALALAGVVVLSAGPGLAAEYEVRMPVEKTARISPPQDVSTPPKTDKAEPAKDSSRTAPKTALGRAAEAAAVANGTATAHQPKTASKSPEGGATKPAKPEPAAQVAEKPMKPAEAAAQKSAPKPKKGAKQAATSEVGADPDSMPTPGEGVVFVPSGAPIPVPAPAEAGAAPSKPAQKPEPKAESRPKPEPKPKPEPRIDPKSSVMPPATAAAPIALPGDGMWVGEVRVDFESDRIVLRAATNAEVERVTWFNVTSPAEPRKLAIDLRGGWRKKGGSVVRFDTGPVKAVVSGEHPDRLRLAIEFRDGAVAQSVDPVVVEKTPTGVVLAVPLAVRLSR